MADQVQIEHSYLELLKHDTTANAPERDQFADAPELDQLAYILQVSAMI